MQLGDVVLIRDDNYLPRQKWRLGKVEELVVGIDGNIRGAKLKVASKTGETTICHSPVQKLVPFEIVDNERSADTDKHDKGVIVLSKRPTRKAAKEGGIIKTIERQVLLTISQRGENVKNEQNLLILLSLLL